MKTKHLKTYDLTFYGRELNAIGIFYKHHRRVSAYSKPEAIKNLYDTHQDISHITCTAVEPDAARPATPITGKTLHITYHGNLPLPASTFITLLPLTNHDGSSSKRYLAEPIPHYRWPKELEEYRRQDGAVILHDDDVSICE